MGDYTAVLIDAKLHQGGVDFFREWIRDKMLYGIKIPLTEEMIARLSSYPNQVEDRERVRAACNKLVHAPRMHELLFGESTPELDEERKTLKSYFNMKNYDEEIQTFLTGVLPAAISVPTVVDIHAECVYSIEEIRTVLSEDNVWPPRIPPKFQLRGEFQLTSCRVLVNPFPGYMV